MCLMAAMASRFSVRLTGRPAVRSSPMKPASSSVSAMPGPISASRVVASSTDRGRRGPSSPSGAAARRRSVPAASPAPACAPWRPASMPASAAAEPPLDEAGAGPPAGSSPSATALPGLGPGARRGLAAERAVLLELAGGLGDVALVLEQDVGGARGDRRVHLLDAEQQQGPGPVERLGHRRRLLEVELADRADDPGHLVGQALGDVGHLGQHDLALAVEVRVVDVEEQAAPLERLGQLPGVVRGEEDQRDLRRRDRAQLGDRHLVVGEDLQQQRLGLDLDPVDLVDEEHDGVLGSDGLEQRAGEQEVGGEDVVLDLLPRGAVVALGLDAQQLLLVVPLVQGLGLVEALVALQADQPGAADLGHGLGELGLARAGRPLDQDRLAEAIGEVHDAGDALVGQVVDLGERLAYGRDGLEAVRRIGHRARLPAQLTAGSSRFAPGSRPVARERSSWATAPALRTPLAAARGRPSAGSAGRKPPHRRGRRPRPTGTETAAGGRDPFPSPRRWGSGGGGGAPWNATTPGASPNRGWTKVGRQENFAVSEVVHARYAFISYTLVNEWWAAAKGRGEPRTRDQARCGGAGEGPSVG